MTARKLFTYFLLISLYAISPYTASTQVNKNDSLALVDLFDSTGGNDPAFWNTNWNLNTPVTTWYGITVKNKRVTSIVLKNNFLVGNIPSTIGKLTRLRTLDLSYNFIRGTLPDAIGSLVNLEIIDIGRTPNGNYYNDITGSIPSSFENLKQLKTLNLSFTRINGNLPSFLGNLLQLQTLNLGYTSIAGRIPAEIGNLKYLQILDLSNMLVSGALPSSLCKLRNLVIFNLYNDQLLSGRLPDSLFNPNITYLNFNHCGFTGKIPSTFSQMLKAETIDLRYNQFSGTVPAINFPKLTYLDLGNNSLRGPILSSLTASTNLQTLVLKNNSFSGKIPAGIFNLDHLALLDLSYNSFSGSIPTSMQTFNLQSLYLNNNQFTGNVPSSIGNLNSLRYLYLNNNNFSGLLPISIGNLVLYDMSIAYNNFLAPFPVLNNYPFTYDISYNKFNFSGLENFVGNTDSLAGNYGKYAPQASIPIYFSNQKLSVSAGGTLRNNTFKWYKGSNLIATTNGDSTLKITGNGRYSVTVTNSIAKALTLYSDTIIIPAQSFIASAASANKDGMQATMFTAAISPNPVSGNTINLAVNSNQLLQAIVVIKDLTGKSVYKNSVAIDAGTTVSKINGITLPAGIYYLDIFYGKNNKQIKFIKAD